MARTACEARAQLAICILDSRRAGVRLRHVADPQSAAAVGRACRVRRVLRIDVRGGSPQGAHSAMASGGRWIQSAVNWFEGGDMNRREFARLLTIGGAAPFLTPGFDWPRAAALPRPARLDESYW